jgi:recombination protein RecA
MKEKKANNIDLDGIVALATKKFGKGCVTLNSGTIEPIPSITTGSPSLDDALGVGGYPCGRIIEVFGSESSGKTTLALIAAAQVQMNGGRVAYIDVEHALDIKYAKALGVDVDSLLLSQPDSAEDALNMVIFYAENGLVDLVVLDSVAALVPQAELDGEIGDSQIGVQARLMGQLMRKLAGFASKSGIIALFINQTRSTIGGYGNSETTPGGKALKFYSSVRIRVYKGAAIKSKDREIGTIIKTKVVKNKVAFPFREAESYLYYGKGFDPIQEYIPKWVAAGIVDKSGAWYSFRNEQLGQGLLAVSSLLLSNNKLFNEIQSAYADYKKGEVDGETEEVGIE